MKLNGWQRIGVVASALWAIGAAIYERSSQVSEATTFHKSALSNCLPEFTGACIDAAHENYRSLLSLDFVSMSNIVFVAIGPVLLGWFLAYLIVKTIRWIKAGFQ
jgi:hypothetical protein